MTADADILDLDGLGAASGDALPSRKTYAITLDGPGLKIERVLSEGQAWTVLSVIFNRPSVPPASSSLTPPAAGHGNGGSAEVPAQRKESDLETKATLDTPAVALAPPSVGEFVAGTGAPNNRSKITAIGAYLQGHAEKQVFTREEVRAQFQRAGEPKPANFHRDFAQAVSKKWVAPATDEGTFYVTNSGQQAIKAHFTDERRTPTPSGRGKTKKAAEEADS